MVVLVACRTDMYVGDISNHLPSVLVGKGADLVLAFPSVQDEGGEWVDMVQPLRMPWNERFWALATGNEQSDGAYLSIRQANTQAVLYAITQCPLCTVYERQVFEESGFTEGSGESADEYLWPARYGNSTN